MIGRVLCIGLDGATFDILDPMFRRGWTPSLASLVEQGARGILRSTVPALSGPAWVTFMTGKSPGRHGIYDFGVRRGGYLNRMFRTTMLEELTVWELVDRAGGESVVVNVPMTYPPHRVRGAVVTGLMTPGTESEFTHPPELKDEIARRWPGYQIDVKLVGSAPAPFLAEHLENNRKLGEMALELLRRRPWSYAMVCFVGTDRIQHLLYRQLLHPDRAAGPTLAGLEAYYRSVDGYIAEMVRLAGDATVLVVSDHGFTSCRGDLHPNEWLAHRGFLVKSAQAGRGATGTLVRWARKLGINNRNLQRVAGRLGMRGVSLRRVERFSPFVNAVDWSLTRAFYASTDGISINLRGREPQGIVAAGSEYEILRDELIAELSAMQHLDGSGPAFRAVRRREEVHDGPFREHAPDVVLEPDGLRITGNVPPPGSDTSQFLVPPGVWEGVHHPDGILVAWGPLIRRGALERPADLRDVAPTTLWALGLDVPEDMDGRVLDELWRDEVRRARPSRRAGSGRRGGDASPAPADEDQAKLEEQLRSLGYL